MENGERQGVWGGGRRRLSVRLGGAAAAMTPQRPGWGEREGRLSPESPQRGQGMAWAPLPLGLLSLLPLQPGAEPGLDCSAAVLC